MRKIQVTYLYIVIYLMIILMPVLISLGIDTTVTAISDSQIQNSRATIVIDAGHGGEDGGATSCTGVLESEINLSIAKRFNDLMHLLGMPTVMIRNTDISVYTEGKSLSEKKISDLKQRLSIVNSTQNPILISIHQNHYPDKRYHGAQVFYAGSKGSKELAEYIQSAFRSYDVQSGRSIKQGKGIFLMEKIASTGVLVECGFLSNPEEENKLRDPMYQKEICCIIACGLNAYLQQNAYAA